MTSETNVSAVILNLTNLKTSKFVSCLLIVASIEMNYFYFTINNFDPFTVEVDDVRLLRSKFYNALFKILLDDTFYILMSMWSVIYTT